MLTLIPTQILKRKKFKKLRILPFPIIFFEVVEVHMSIVQNEMSVNNFGDN